MISIKRKDHFLEKDFSIVELEIIVVDLEEIQEPQTTAEMQSIHDNQV